MVARKRCEEAFLVGYKPALLAYEETKSELYFDQLFEYPHIKSFSGKSDTHIFFQSEELKSTFESQAQNIDLNSPEGHLIIGQALGFPRRSVEFFAKMRELEEANAGQTPEEDKVFGCGISWAGFNFHSSIEFVDQEIEWLWSTYHHPKTLEEPLRLRFPKDGFIKIPYGDLATVKKIVMIQRGKLGLMPTA